MGHLKLIVSKKLAVTAAAVAFIQTLPIPEQTRAVITAALALGYVLAQAYVDAAAPKE